MKTREQKVIDRDDDLLKRERSIKFTRTAATFFAALMFFAFIMHSVHVSKYAAADVDAISVIAVSTDAGTIDLKIPIILMCAFFVWAALAHEYNLRVRHIDSIKMYRSKLKEQGTKISQQENA
jgi:hypothetical protein